MINKEKLIYFQSLKNSKTYTNQPSSSNKIFNFKFEDPKLRPLSNESKNPAQTAKIKERVHNWPLFWNATSENTSEATITIRIIEKNCLEKIQHQNHHF